MLPHTVYLYQKKAVEKGAIKVEQAEYLPQQDVIVCDLENLSSSLLRVQAVRAAGPKESVVMNGFPLLPGSPRHLEIPWKKKTTPSYLLLKFPHFDVKEPLPVKGP
jgi:hypothetical protein